MKKFLAVATALVLAISSLCVFVVADDTATVVDEQTSTGTLTILSGVDFTDEDLYLYVNYTLDDSDYAYYGPGSLCDSSWANVIYLDSYNASSGTYVISLVDLAAQFEAAGYDATSGVVLNFWGTSYSTFTSAQLVDTGSDEEDDEESTAADTSSWQLALNGFNTSWGGWSSVYESAGTLTVSATIAEIMDANGITSTSEFGGFIAQVWNIPSDQDGAVKYSYTLEINGAVYASGTDVTVSLESDGTLNVKQVQDTTIWGDYDFASLTGSEVVTFTVYDVKVISTSSSESGNTSTSASGVTGTIYINEEYHGMFIVRNGKKFMISIPHTVGDDGYCTVCHEYIGTDGDVATTDINGGEYVVAYTSDINLSSGSWSDKDLGDTSILDALATEGALLVVTRDSEQNIVFSSEETIYEKFVLVNSWYSGNTVQLGTAGHTSADEADAGIIDCISDDGTVAMYDGNTIYDTWVANGLNAGGTVLFISNTSSTDYKIANVTVYVPAGSTTVEDVDVTEPAEPTDTETEDDGTDDVEVTENDTTADTNPTTGVVLALVPMAIAGFAAVASKRK